MTAHQSSRLHGMSLILFTFALLPLAAALSFQNAPASWKLDINQAITMVFGSTNNGPVTVSLVNGTEASPNIVQMISANTTETSVQYRPDSSVLSGRYMIQAKDRTTTIYSPEMVYTAPNTQPIPQPSPSPNANANPNSQSNSSSDGGGLSTGAAAGIGVGVGIAFIALTMLAGYFGYKRGYRKGRGDGLEQGAALRESAAAVALAGKDGHHPRAPDEESRINGAPSEGYYGQSIGKAGTIGSGGVGGSVLSAPGAMRPEPMGDDVLGGGKEHVPEFGHGGAGAAGPSHAHAHSPPPAHVAELETTANVPEIAGRGDEGRHI